MSDDRSTRLIVERHGNPIVTIVVAVIADPDRLRQCLTSALAAAREDRVAIDLVLVLDGAHDDVHRFVAHGVVGATVLSWPERRGFAAALNAGFRAATTPYVVVLQDDTSLLPGWLATITETAERLPKAGAIGGLVLWPDGSMQTAGAVIGGDGATTVPWCGDPPDPETLSEVRSVDYVSSSSMFVRRAAWAAVGGFDEEMYPTVYVDADFCTALWNAGWQVVCDPRAAILHGRSGSSPDSLKTLVWPVNRIRFMTKWSGFVNGRPLWATIPITAVDLAAELQRAHSWLESPPPVTLHTEVGEPTESPVDVYVSRERDLLRRHVAHLQAQLDALTNR